MWPILKAMPVSITEKLDPGMGLTVRWQIIVENLVDDIIRRNKEGKRAEGTIFQAILDSDRSPEYKTRDAMVSEGFVVVGAGSETTANTLTFITYYLYMDKQLLQKLRDELSNLTPESDGLFKSSDLEKLPYLVSRILCLFLNAIPM